MRTLLFLQPLLVLVSALNGLYYQVYTDTYVATQMQPNLSCVTAIFDEINRSRGFYMFNGYNVKEQQISKYKGQLVPSYKNKNCYEMKPSHGEGRGTNTTQKICVFAVDTQKEYLVVTNGNFKRTFVLTQYQPNLHPLSLHEPEFSLINATIAAYGLPTDLVPTNHASCFFYPPKDLDYIIKKPPKRSL